MLGLEVSRFKKDIFYVNSEYSRPGLSNKRLRLWLLAALESQSNLTRYVIFLHTDKTFLLPPSNILTQRLS